MAVVLTDLDDAITYLNTLYEGDSDVPASDEDDYTIWTSLFNVAINIWESEEGVLWRELFVDLADAADGDKSTDGTTSYTLPTDFIFPASGFVWTGTGTNKTAYKVIRIEDFQELENSLGRWCYFVGTSTLEFNPNLSMTSGDTISYNYYKSASKVSTGTDTFEMSDPMFAVYYALSELKKEEGDTSAALIASQKLEAMKVKNEMPAFLQGNSLIKNDDDGFGV